MGFVARERKEVRNDRYDQLVEKIKEVADRLEQIEIRRKAGRAGYKAISTIFDVLVEAEDGQPLDPDKLAQAVLGAAEEHASEEGPEHYQIAGLGRGVGKAKNTSGVQLFVIALRCGDSEATVSSKEARADEVIQASELSRRMAGDSHKRNMETLDKTIALADKVVQLATAVGSQQTNPVELLDAAFKLEDRRFAHEETIHGRDTWSKFADKVVDTVGKDLSGIFSEWMKRHLQMDPDTMKGPLASRLQAILDSTDDAGRAKIRELFGDDTWDTIQAALKAKDDEQFKQILGRLTALWERRGLDNVKKVLPEVQKVLGNNFLALLHLLKEVGVID